MAYNPESHKGQKMYVRGLLIKLPSEQRMTISSFDTIAPSCSNEPMRRVPFFAELIATLRRSSLSAPWRRRAQAAGDRQSATAERSGTACIAPRRPRVVRRLTPRTVPAAIATI